MKRVIGLMSGTSLDGVDAALLGTDGTQIAAFGPGELRLYTDLERQILQDAVNAALAWNFEGDAPDFREAEAVLTHSHTDAVNAVLQKSGLKAGDIDLIGFHGQTVLHRPPNDSGNGRTLQIGNGQALSDSLGIDVVSDFRSADMEAGGQGAPLVPLYHKALVEKAELEGPIAILNLGGVANVTWIDGDQDPISFDTGPANSLIDTWCAMRIGRGFDANGELAAAGRIDADALTALMDHPFFDQKPPKSLDRWDFKIDPVKALGDADGAATLTAFTAKSVAGAMNDMGQMSRLLVTGGGRHNPVMMRMLAAALGIGPEPVEVVGWRGDLLEAEAFAWLAARVEVGLPTSLPSTTGANGAVCGGNIARPKIKSDETTSQARTDDHCPVCGLQSAKPKKSNDDAACSCCSSVLGRDDLVAGHAKLRDAWVARGMKWSSTDTPAPAGWNPVTQLMAVT
ncbi:MAG: anhydro-N-acetylmuramic acid kinase [Maricaulis sp.]|nr:anhydro-N-acetylmuramic acid kinase [Maricaulis sp.]